MKIKFKLSIVVISIMAAVIAGITSLLLWQSSKNTLQLSLRSQENLANSRAEFWKGQEEGYIRALNTLGNVMGDYETVKPEDRRDKYDELLKSALNEEPQMVTLYTVWKRACKQYDGNRGGDEPDYGKYPEHQRTGGESKHVGIRNRIQYGTDYDQHRQAERVCGKAIKQCGEIVQRH